jgi:spermidine/putrescine transport system substrate-binding protein
MPNKPDWPFNPAWNWAWGRAKGNPIACICTAAILRRISLSIIVLLNMAWLAACSSSQPPRLPSLPSPVLAKELVFCDYVDDLPQEVLNGFTAETGVEVRYQTFESMEEAVEFIETKKNCDVVNLDNRFVFQLSQAGQLAKLNRANLPNLKNISANFRDMVYDPQNLYTVPYNWGTTGLLFRSDLVQAARWSDFWNPVHQGKIGLWRGEPRDGIGLALKALGFSANSEEPSEVRAAVDHLIELNPRIVLLDDAGQAFADDYLNEGTVMMALGWAADAIRGRAANPAIQYCLPAEGALLWGENFVIPVSSPNQATVETFLNYVLRPRVSAQIVNLNSYATPNQAAFTFINPDILHDPMIFPPNETLINAEIILPLSTAGEKLYAEEWSRFLDSLVTR